MKIKILFKTIRDREKPHLNTDKALARYLGITQATLISWRKYNQEVNSKKIARMIKNTRISATQMSYIDTIKPIVEYFPVNPWRRSKRSKYQIFESGNNATRYKNELKDKLNSSHGIYVFHDSRGRALYAGKARKLKLWNEINNTLNRERAAQTMFRIEHPDQERQFRDAHEMNRQPTKYTLYLYELAKYISAYKIVDGMIDRLEALLVRSFSNDLLNKKMEKFGRTNKKRKRRKAS